MAQHEREMIAQPTSRTQLIMELSNHSAALVSNLPADLHMQLHTLFKSFLEASAEACS
jgi:hypothetical protein